MHELGRAATKAVAEARSTASSATRASEPKAPLPPQALDLIAATMTSAFGHRWTSVHGDNFAETSGRIWAIELAGFGQRAIQRGLDRAVKCEWPPVLAEFKGMCIGVLPLATVKAQRAGKASDQHPFTILVGRFVPYHEWRMADPVAQDRMLQAAWDQAREHLLAGGAMPSYTPAEQQLTAEDERPPPPPIMMTSHQAMEEIRRALHIPEAQPEPEPASTISRNEPCRRCKGSRKDPLGDAAWHPQQQVRGECLACYGSGNEASYNRIVHEDGTTEERI